MKIALLDTNIYDILARDLEVCAHIQRLVENANLKILVTRTVYEELQPPPFGGVPKLFPIEFSGNTVAVAGIMCAGDSVGSGDIFFAHKGDSNKVNDALVADAASWKADWLVSEDRRLRNQFTKIPSACVILSYAEFVQELAALDN